MHNQIRACYDAIEHLDKFFGGDNKVHDLYRDLLENVKCGLYALASKMANDVAEAIEAETRKKAL